MTGCIGGNMKEKEQVRGGEPAPFPSINQIKVSFRMNPPTGGEMRNLKNAIQ